MVSADFSLVFQNFGIMAFHRPLLSPPQRECPTLAPRNRTGPASRAQSSRICARHRCLTRADRALSRDQLRFGGSRRRTCCAHETHQPPHPPPRRGAQARLARLSRPNMRMARGLPRCMTTSHAHLCASVSTCAQVRALTVEVTRNEADWAAQLGPGGSWVENVDSCLKRHVPARGPRRWRGSSRHLGIPPSPNRACVLEWSATGWKNLTH